LKQSQKQALSRSFDNCRSLWMERNLRY